MILTKPCLFCGKEIIKQPSRSLKDWYGRTKYCSRSCRSKYIVTTEHWLDRQRESHLGLKQSMETRKKHSEAQKGCKGSNWRGDNIGYTGVHVWLNITFGKPDKCENKSCVYPRMGAKKMLYKPCWFEWALIKGKEMKRRRENFVKLCLACHRKYDGCSDGGGISI